MAAQSSGTSHHPVRCSEHPDEEVRLYCKSCVKLVCTKCGIKGGSHHSHDCELLDEALQKHKDKIRSSLRPLDMHETHAKQTLTLIDSCHQEICDQKASITDSINHSVKELQDKLESRRKQLISQLDKTTESKLKELSDKKEQLLSQIKMCQDFVKKRIESIDVHDLQLTRDFKEVEVPFPPESLDLNTKADMSFVAVEMSEIKGWVGAPNSPDPTRFYATGNGLKKALVGDTTTATVHAISYNGEPCPLPIGSLKCELVSVITGKSVPVVVRGLEESKCEISYQPTIKGKHQLHVKVDGMHIRGSPFIVTVTSSIQTLGTSFHTIQGVKKPYGVALTSDNDLVVSAEHEHCIHLFSSSGKKLRSFGSKGTAQGQLSHPQFVAVDSNDNVLIADMDNHRVQIMTPGGQFAAKTVSKFNIPDGVAYNVINKKVYVSDSHNDRIQVLNSDLTLSSLLGEFGESNGQFSRPRGVVCDAKGRIYVADSGRHRIQVFAPDGTFIKAFGRCGRGKGELRCPVGLALDASGMLYVSECDNHRVSMFDQDFKFVKSFGRHGKGPGQFHCPRGIAVDEDGIVYICDSINNRIQLL